MYIYRVSPQKVDLEKQYQKVQNKAKDFKSAEIIQIEMSYLCMIFFVLRFFQTITIKILYNPAFMSFVKNTF